MHSNPNYVNYENNDNENTEVITYESSNQTHNNINMIKEEIRRAAMKLREVRMREETQNNDNTQNNSCQKDQNDSTKNPKIVRYQPTL